MNDRKPPKGKKPRVTVEQLTDIRRYYREGLPVTQIAEKTRLHRHTIRTYIKEKFEDVIADEARKSVLMEGLQQHYRDLSDFARLNLRAQLDASVPQSRKETAHAPGSISTDGIMALPFKGTPQYMAQEWIRMYPPSPRADHLMKSLRAHTKASGIWTHWDKWRKIVSAYRDSSKKLWERFDEKIKNKPQKMYHPLDMDSFREHAFGNILRIIDSDGSNEPEIITVDTAGDGILPIVKSKDSQLTVLLKDIIDEVRGLPEWSSLIKATATLKYNIIQEELRRLARKIDAELVSVELMHAFSGRCELCPV